MKRHFSKAEKTIVAGLLLAGIFGVFKLASAAVVNVGLTPEVGNALGLGTQDVRVTVAIIIRDFMGLLGIIAVVLVLYGGFLWMTAGGEEEKIDKAKKTIVAAVIGLAIVLSAVAIAQFALNALGSATGLENGGGFGGAGGGGGGGLAIGTLYVEDISPSGDVPLRNVVVRIIFSRPLDANTVTGKVAVTGPNGAVAGKLSVNGDLVEFEPDAACPAPNGTLKCFDANTSYNVTVSTGIKSSNDQPLVCGGLAPPCSATFKSGDLIDISAPNPVSVQAPDDGQSLPEGAPVPVQINAVDDTGISFEEAFVDGASVGKASPGAVTKDFTGTVNWTEGVTLGDHSLSAKADDLDKHSGSSEAVGVVVRPTHCFNTVLDADETGLNCGGSCGGCADNACVKNSDCASGLCENGICVNRPRIDAVTPLNGSKRPYGAPGTLVTISGAFFGNGPGKVTFNGAAPSDQKEAVTCSAAAWSDSEITVVVPDGAKSGPIAVTAANAQTDATNDSRGAMINDFEAGNQTHPGICELTPGSGESGTQVTLAGQGFGDTEGSGAVMFRLGGQDTSASNIETADWSASSVKTNVPSINVSSAATVAVRLVQNGVASNNKGFYLSPLGAGKAPRIDAIDPTNGPVREYITLRGQNFGAKAGTVIFALPDQTTAVGNTDFPSACAVEFWKDDEITVKVPEFYKDGKTPLQEVAHSIKVRRADTVESNSVSFSVKAGVAGPGICAIVPDNGAPVATKVDVYGERFGSVTGVLVFTDKLAANPVVKWSDGQITKAVVPAAAATGPVRVVTADKQQSNSVNFFVGACSGNDQCKLGQSCCADGTCRVSCVAVATAGGHAWRFSTGEIPKLPQVVEEKSCSNVTQSPSPYKSTTDACFNADLSVRFTAKMEKASLVPNFFVYKCGATAEFDPSTCKMDAPLAPAFAPTVTDWAKDQSMLAFALKDQDRSPDTWYFARVVSRESSTSTIGARSVDGLYLDGDYDGVEGGNYEWRYRTRAGSANCEVDHLEVSPSDYLSSLKNEQLGYRADPTAANCNLLSCIGFSWQWQSLLTGPGNLSADSYAPLTPVTGEPECVRVATTLKETPPAAPVREIATILPQGKTDFGVLAISFLKPEVANYWPSCTGACVNAGVGAEFTIGMDPKTLVPNAAKICECTEESCSVLKNCSDQNPGVTLELGPIKTVEGVDHVMGFRFQNLQHFKKQTWYRVLIQGGDKGVKSESGSALVGLNYGQTYSWKFRTRNDDALCEVDRVSLAPANATLYVMGDTAEYQAIPWSKGDDKCGPTPLAATDYGWNWGAKNLSSAATPAEGVDVSTLPQFAIATLDFSGKKDTMPLKDSVGCQAMCLNAGSQPGLAVCGDGIVSPSEDCDGGAGCDPKTCLWTGKATACANPGPNSTDVGCCGNLKIEPGEQCDDANLNSGDGCSSHCMAEGSTAGGSTCGNGDLGKGETCDDGNNQGGDGCSGTCLKEGALVQAPYPVCGNGKLEAGEDCDDGNVKDGDGCSSHCLAEGTALCQKSGQTGCCGNKKIEPGEQCDDGNGLDGDSCGSNCLFEGSSSRYNLFQGQPSYCGYLNDAVPPSKYGTGEVCEFPHAGDSRPDPSQVARANFGGEAEIGAAVTNPSTQTVAEAKAGFSFICDCTDDLSCKSIVPGSKISSAGVGCGLGHCCYTRPVVLANYLSPASGESDVCRNALISARFNQVMDRDSLASSTFLLIKNDSGKPCAAGTEVKIDTTYTDLIKDYCLTASSTLKNYSVSTAEITDEKENDPQKVVKTEMRINLTEPLNSKAEYAVLILGDHNLDDAVPAGAQSGFKVGLAGDYYWKFRTGAEICQIDHVTVGPEWWLFQTAQNDPADDPAGPFFDSLNDNDKQFTADAWTKHNQTNERITPVTGYDWAWIWSDSDDKEASIKKPKAGDFETQVIQTVGAPKNDEVSILARATVTENVFGASCAANTDCVGGELCKSTPQGQKCAGKNFEAHAKAVVLICENPWPSRELNGIWKPFVDTDTNFSDYYCRDAGKPADTSDDLPVPVSKTPVVITHQKEKVCSNDPSKSCFSSADCGANALCQDRLIKDLLFTLNCPDGSCNPGDAFGYRVMPNLGHLDIAKWYALQGFSGTPAPTTIDGYAALADDRSTYVSAVNQSSVPKLYTNIYLLSSNEGASANTRRIAQSLLLNWSFNANLSSSGLCHSNVCSNDGAKACLSAADCGKGGSCGSVSCRSDFDCGGAAGGVCDAFKEKMQRDVARFSDFRELERGLESYRASRLHCSLSTTRACLVDENCPGEEHCVGDYPVLASGSFIRGLSVSLWESWQNTLGGDLKMTPVPNDPLNRLICDKAAGYDENTCYRSSDQTFACAPGSRAYQYRREGKAYRLASDFEYRVCSNDASRSCVSNSNCALFQNGALVNGVCLTPPWEGQGPITPVEFDEAAGVAAPIPNVWDLSNACTGQVFGGAAGVCGDGSVGPTEECEVGQKKAVPCKAGGYDGYQTEACGTSGANACKWVPVGGCNAGKCGDGIVQTGEQCDDGVLNGTYGHCETSCMKPATAGHCGDGITQGSESCDFGGYCKKNPSQPCKKDNDCWGALYILDYCVGADIYGGISPDASCAFDCKSPGPYCGDKIVQGDYGEQCDGNTEIDTTFCPKCPDGNSPSTNPLYKNCTVDTANRSQIRTRGCSWLVNKSTACQWAGWSDCSPVGVCGDGVVNPGEECDDGNDNNNDGCVIVKKYVNGKFIVDAPNSCKKSKCGDGYVQSGVEVCDAGGNNVNMSDKQAVAAEADKCPYGKVCQICSTACASASVSGGYCGDLKVTPNYEICEPGLGKRTGPEADAVNANYPGVDQICYPNCQGYCPADFTKSPPFKFVSSLQSPNYVTQVDNLKNKEQWYIAMPACRYLDGISMDLNFIQAEPPKTAILMVANLGTEMTDSYTKAGGISKMMAAKIFMRSVVGTAGQLYENFPGKLKMGLLTGGHLEDAFPKPYDPANHVSGNQKFVQNTCSKFVAGWAKDNNGKIEVAGDGTGYCYVTAPIEQSKIGWQCTYSCVAERSAMAHAPGPQETSNWYVSGSGGSEMVKLQSLINTLPDWPTPFSSGNFATALDQAIVELSAADADRKILLVADGDESNAYCPYGNGLYSKAYKAGIKIYSLELKNGAPCPATQYLCGDPPGSEQCPQVTFAYDQSEKLKEQLFNAVTSIKLSFNGQPAAPYPLNSTLTLPTKGLTCLDHEQRLPFSIDWGGEGAVQVKNLIPSYCPLTPGNQPSSVGSFSTGNGFNFSNSNNLGGSGLKPFGNFDLYGNNGKYPQFQKIPPP